MIGTSATKHKRQKNPLIRIHDLKKRQGCENWFPGCPDIKYTYMVSMLCILKLKYTVAGGAPTLPLDRHFFPALRNGYNHKSCDLR